MGRAEVGTPKFIANQMKAKGLQKLKWYCQVCEKQCRDENGFKCHTMSESHLRKVLEVGESRNGADAIEKYSQEFLKGFLSILKTKHGEKQKKANLVYQEYIQDKNHVHMNSTKWTSLSSFIAFLGKEGICRVVNDEKDGLCISYIDNSSENALRLESLKKLEKSKKSDEEIQVKLLEKQIEAAKRQAEKVKLSEKEKEAEENRGKLLKPNETVKFQLQVKKGKNDKEGQTTETGQQKVGFSLKSAKQKKPNVFKQAAKRSRLADAAGDTKSDVKRSLNSINSPILKDESQDRVKKLKSA